jgi:hypothetical protein
MGLARFFKDHTDQLTIKYDDKIVLGTADYVAPEQVANSHSVDIRADIYALGATLYFMLAGHPPFPTGTVSQKLLWHRTKEPTPIRTIRPEVPEGLAAVLARLMAKDPKARYQTPAQAAADLAQWVPAEVPLPAAEELPQLSPAVAELLADEPLAADVPAAAQAVAEANGPARGTAVADAPPVAPFGPVAADPWASPAAPAVKTTPPPPQAVTDTAVAVSVRTPLGPQPAPFSDANPFAGGDASRGPAKKTNWPVLIAIVVAVLGGLGLAALKLGG